MSNTTRDIKAMFPTSSASTVTTPLGHLDDASNITIFLTSDGGLLSSNLTLQINQLDPFDSTSIQSGTSNVTSTTWFTISTGVLSSGIFAFALSNISFRGVRLVTSGVTSTSIPVAVASKQISV